MQSVNGYGSATSGEYKFDVRVNIAGSYYYLGTKGHEYEASGTLISLVTRAHTFGTNTLTIGRADSREIELSLFGRSSRIPRNAEMNIEVKAVSADGNIESDWFPKGTFFIDTRSKDSQHINNEEVLHITGFDAMMRGECVFDEFPESYFPLVDVPADEGGGHTTTYEIMRYAAAEKLLVSIDSWTESTVRGNSFDVPLPTQYSIREALQNVAALYGGSFIINDRGELQLITLWRDTTIYDLGVNCQGLTVYENYGGCTGIRMLVRDEGYQQSQDEENVDYYYYGRYGTGNEAEAERTGYVYEIGSPWGTQAQTQWLYSQMQTRRYCPYEVSTAELDLRVEIGDRVSVGSPDGNSVTGGVYSQTIDFGPYITSDFGAPGEEEIDHEYSYQSSKDRNYTRRLYAAEATLSIHQDEIMARVKKIDGNEEESFGWSLQSDHWEVFAGEGDNRQIVLYVDKDGLQVYGGGTFTGTLEAGEIYIPNRDDYNFMVDRSGHMEARDAEVTGIIRASSFQTSAGDVVATLSDLDSIRQLQGGLYGGGMLGSLQTASLLNRAINGNAPGEYPTYFTAGTLIGKNGVISQGNVTAAGSMTARHYYVTDSGQHGDDSIDLATHSHSIRFSEEGDSIKLTISGPTGINPSTASFRIAATTTYQNMVAALTVTNLSISSSYNSGTHKYGISVTAYNAAGNALMTRGTTTDTDAWEAGYSAGYNAGYSDGTDDGYSSGYVDGESDGYSDGYWDGYYDGLDEGQYNAYVWLDWDADYNWDGELYRYSIYAYCSNGDYDHDYLYV